MLSRIRRFLRSAHRDAGATAVEYGLLVAGIAAVIIAAVVILGGQVNDGFETVNTNLEAVPAEQQAP